MSLAVRGLPSDQVTPWRSVKVQVSLSGLDVQFVARVRSVLLSAGS